MLKEDERRLKMLKNKKGLSAIVMTIIMIGLVLVAVGIVWTVISGLLEGQTETVEYSEKCLGISLDIKNLDCDADVCNFTVSRKVGSAGAPIDGLSLSFSTASETGDEVLIEGNIAAASTKSNEDHKLDETPIRVDARVYFNKTEGDLFYCSQIISATIA